MDNLRQQSSSLKFYPTRSCYPEWHAAKRFAYMSWEYVFNAGTSYNEIFHTLHLTPPVWFKTQRFTGNEKETKSMYVFPTGNEENHFYSLSKRHTNSSRLVMLLWTPPMKSEIFLPWLGTFSPYIHVFLHKIALSNTKRFLLSKGSWKGWSIQDLPAVSKWHLKASRCPPCKWPPSCAVCSYLICIWPQGRFPVGDTRCDAGAVSNARVLTSSEKLSLVDPSFIH